MQLKFSDGAVIEIPAKKNAVEFLYRNHPQYVRKYAQYLEHVNRSFHEIDQRSRIQFHNIKQ